MSHSATDVVDFWRTAGAGKWFAKDDAFDQAFRTRFLDLHFAAARRERDDWLATPPGALALLILLDQFPRNAFRGTAHMFATDPLALGFARLVVARELDRQVEPLLRVFCYLPFEHSEAAADQERSVVLCDALRGHDQWAHMHRDIIRRFGRFPHRNAVLGRETTPEEQAFLEAGGFTG
ncbi:MAG: DUF924 family protein [Rhodanobacter sp.]|nr:MAG: DUF924 family protein [Rhodanobacter sp.]TAM10058.1 MAG: DUF924 family protein [Rhodanobacter sp.]TAM34725.1 MAG: DUF924 family protein [Rhodanobacter sp.]